MIDFKFKALEALDNSAEIGGGPESAYFGAAAQVHATLHLADQVAALVEQQRVSNQIAVYGVESAEGNGALAATLWDDHVREGLAL